MIATSFRKSLAKTDVNLHVHIHASEVWLCIWLFSDTYTTKFYIIHVKRDGNTFKANGLQENFNANLIETVASETWFRAQNQLQTF